MCKASKLKKLRKMAANLPGINYHQKVSGEIITGAELIGKGTTEIAGVPVDPNGRYRQQKIVERPLNHNKKLKNAYKKHGYQGVTGYINAVMQYVQQNKPKEDEHTVLE